MWAKLVEIGCFRLCRLTLLIPYRHAVPMKYDFSSLSHNDFEDLSRDLLGRELGVRFEAFPEGPDDGMDGRHCVGEGSIILQAKHYYRSGFSALKSKMGKERASIDRLQPKRYLLTTSTPLTPGRRATASLILVAQDPQSMPVTVQSQDVSLAASDIVIPPAAVRAVVFIESGT